MLADELRRHRTTPRARILCDRIHRLTYANNYAKGYLEHWRSFQVNYPTIAAHITKERKRLAEHARRDKSLGFIKRIGGHYFQVDINGEIF